MQNKKKDLIDIIARCSEPTIKKAWIIEMAEAGFECSESECTPNCPIFANCLESMEQV